jgi:hypothetical protein
MTDRQWLGGVTDEQVTNVQLSEKLAPTVSV